MPAPRLSIIPFPHPPRFIACFVILDRICLLSSKPQQRQSLSLRISGCSWRYELATAADATVRPLYLQSALREGESIVKEMKDVDAVMAQLLYHYVEKQRLATDKSIEYVSVLQPDTGEWHVHAFLKTPFEADYAAAFERSIQPIDLFHEDVSLANLLSPRHQYRNMFARSKLQRRLDESLVYWFETFFSCLVCLAFRIFAVLEWLRGLVVVSPLFLNFRTAKEMFLATLANYKSWRKRNPLLDNRRYRGVGPVESGTLIAHLTHEESTRAIMGGYDRQGMLLYLRCVVPVDGARLVTRVEWQRFYGDIAAQYHLIGPQLKEVLMRIACIKYTSDGATVSAPAMVLIYAWLYVLGGIVFSVLVGVYNWGNRDNALERVSDVVWVATTLLIAVFGIVKLTSEDPRSIRHALSGQMALMSARHVYEFLQIPLLDEGLTWEDALKGVAAVSPGKLEWLGEYETNFCEGDRIGDIRLPGGLPVRSLPAIVGLPGINGFVNVVLRKYRKTEENTGTDWLYVREEVAQVEVDIAANALKIG